MSHDLSQPIIISYLDRIHAFIFFFMDDLPYVVTISHLDTDVTKLVKTFGLVESVL